MKLDALPVLFVDVQTTGAGPKSGRVLEIAWSLGAEETRSLVLRGDAPVPKRILRITGLTEQEIDAGVDEAQAFAELSAQAARASFAVAHFARFEASFLDMPIPWLCTHGIGTRLFPDLPSGSLRALAGANGLLLGECKRATPHVEATRFLWNSFVAQLQALHGITTTLELQAWLARPKNKSTGAKTFHVDRAKRLALPDTPGIYRMLGPGSKVLYVGKATSLKNRVNSYFRQRRGHAALKRELLSQVRDVEVTPCATALEAALLEADEIKRLDPAYNVVLRAYGRRPGFFDRSLAPCPQGTPRAYGPYPSIDALVPLKVLEVGLATRAAEVLAILAELFHREVPMEVMLLGLATFAGAASVQGSDLSARSLLALGIKLARVEDEDEDDGDDEDEIEEAEGDEERPVTPEEVTERLWGVVMSAARAHIRARDLRRLSQAVVAWRTGDDDRWRYLETSGGRVVEGGYTESPGSLRAHAGATTCEWDVAAYDRMRVLRTELAREASAGAEVLVVPPEPKA